MEDLEEIAKKLQGKRVMLQLPDGLKTKIEDILDVLERYDIDVIVNIDPTYGSCDIRTREAEYSGVDAIIHLGHAPMLSIPKYLLRVLEEKC